MRKALLCVEVGDACCLRPLCNSALRPGRTAPPGACALPCGGLLSWLTWSGLRSAGEVGAQGHRGHCCWVGGPAPVDALPSRLKSCFSGGLPRPRWLKPPPPPVPLASLLSAQKRSHTLVRSLPHPPRGAQGCASRDSGGVPVRPCYSPARLTVSAPGLAEEMPVRWSKSVCALTVAHCRDYRKLCLCPLHGLKMRSVKTVLTD